MNSHALAPGLPERLSIERKRVGLSADALAIQTAKSLSTVYAYEAGKTSPTIEYLYELQDLGFDVGFVLSGRPQANMVELDRHLVVQPPVLVATALQKAEVQVTANELWNQRHALEVASQAIAKVPSADRPGIPSAALLDQVERSLVAPLSHDQLWFVGGGVCCVCFA
ncbi:helix-turn-helix domain-containing protein [Piscinibacterium candidicorallinum]|uniref:Helix-turn-helix domain-containing protein n=1 Tax=Piscinibacterium candidicorallinum TaxID=1793872 RepID=A0ABV7H959_9BURK